MRDAIRRADGGDGVVVLGDLGSAILTIRHVLERARNGHVTLVDAPIVEGTVAAAVMASAGSTLDDVRQRRGGGPRCPQALRRLVTLPADVDLHARPAAQFVRTAVGFAREHRAWRADGREADAKSLLAILALGAERRHAATPDAPSGDDAPPRSTLCRLRRRLRLSQPRATGATSSATSSADAPQRRGASSRDLRACSARAPRRARRRRARRRRSARPRRGRPAAARATGSDAASPHTSTGMPARRAAAHRRGDRGEHARVVRRGLRRARSGRRRAPRR